MTLFKVDFDCIKGVYRYYAYWRKEDNNPWSEIYNEVIPADSDGCNYKPLKYTTEILDFIKTHKCKKVKKYGITVHTYCEPSLMPKNWH